MVACVGADEDEGVGRRCHAREAAEVADCVPGSVKQVERAVAEIVHGREASYTKTSAFLLEVNLLDGAACDVGV